MGLSHNLKFDEDIGTGEDERNGRSNQGYIWHIVTS